MNRVVRQMPDVMIGIAIAAVSVCIFAVIAFDVIGNEIVQFDTVITNYIQSFRGPLMNPFMIAVTFLGKVWGVLLFGIPALLWLYRRSGAYIESVMLLISTVGGTLINVMLKHIFRRERPQLSQLVTETSLSFPSGHATVAFVFFGMVGYLLWRHAEGRVGMRWLISIGFPAFMIWMGISRVFLGVHYPSDVLAGFASGAFWLAVCVTVLHLWETRLRQIRER